MSKAFNMEVFLVCVLTGSHTTGQRVLVHMVIYEPYEMLLLPSPWIVALSISLACIDSSHASMHVNNALIISIALLHHSPQ
jgi:hypothetical protein